MLHAGPDLQSGAWTLARPHPGELDYYGHSHVTVVGTREQALDFPLHWWFPDCAPRTHEVYGGMLEAAGVEGRQLQVTHHYTDKNGSI